MALAKSNRVLVQLIPGGFILPDEVGDAFAKAGFKRVLLKAYNQDKVVETHVALRRIQEVYRVYFGKQHQKTLGIFPSDIFEIQLFQDTSKYGVEVPEAFQAVMDSDPEGFDIFESLTDGRKRGLIYHIKRYKSEQTQVDKTLIIFDNLKRGIRDPKELIKPL